MPIQNDPRWITYPNVDDFDGNGIRDDLTYDTVEHRLYVKYHQDQQGKNFTYKHIPDAETYIHVPGDDEAYLEFVGDLSGKNPTCKDRVTLYLTDWVDVPWGLWKVERCPIRA